MRGWPELVHVISSGVGAMQTMSPAVFLSAVRSCPPSGEGVSCPRCTRFLLRQVIDQGGSGGLQAAQGPSTLRDTSSRQAFNSSASPIAERVSLCLQ